MSDLNYADCLCTRKDDGSISFEWKGNQLWPLEIAHELLEAEPDLVSRMPWKMIFVRFTDRGDSIYRREEV